MFQGKKGQTQEPKSPAESKNGAKEPGSAGAAEVSKSSSEPQKDRGGETPEGLPLFFKTPAVLEAERHANAGIKIGLPPAFARSTNCIVVNTNEFIEAAKYYPIVFTARDPLMPLAVVGLERENLFIGADGKWREDTYVPAYVRKYPFALLEEPGNDKRLLCVDEGSAYFVKDAKDAKDKDVSRIFDNGKPTPYATQALEFCAAYQQQHMVTRRFCDALLEMDLLESSVSSIELVTGRKLSLGGFKLIDQKKFAALPDDKVLKLHQEGWLPLIHFALLAGSNWGRLMNETVVREKAA